MVPKVNYSDHNDELVRLRHRNTWLEEVVAAAKGLAHGSDWNKGTHAILHGYRQKLVDLLAAEPKE